MASCSGFGVTSWEFIFEPLPIGQAVLTAVKGDINSRQVGYRRNSRSVRTEPLLSSPEELLITHSSNSEVNEMYFSWQI